MEEKQKNNKSNRIFCTTDTHGCNKELKKALELVSFDNEVDTLIHLGDCVDRGPDSFGVIETLLGIKNLIAIRGNHDEAFLDFIETGYHSLSWSHGGQKTIMSYFEAQQMPYPNYYVNKKMSGLSTNFNVKHIPQTHKDFFKRQVLYHIDRQNRLFVHAGYDPMEKIETQNRYSLTWDRDLIEHLASYWEDDKPVNNYPDVNSFKRVFVGHTPTMVFKKKANELSPLWLPGGVKCTEPLYLGQLVDLDTGCCFGYKLSIIDITDDENHIVYQVDAL